MERIPGLHRSLREGEGELIDAEKDKFRKAAKVDEKLGTITKSKDVKIYTDRDRAQAERGSRRGAIRQALHDEKFRREAEEEKQRRLLEEAKKGSGG